MITAANKRLALEGDVRAAQGKVDAAEAKVECDNKLNKLIN